MSHLTPASATATASPSWPGQWERVIVVPELFDPDHLEATIALLESLGYRFSFVSFPPDVLATFGIPARDQSPSRGSSWPSSITISSPDVAVTGGQPTRPYDPRRRLERNSARFLPVMLPGTSHQACSPAVWLGITYGRWPGVDRFRESRLVSPDMLLCRGRSTGTSTSAEEERGQEDERGQGQGENLDLRGGSGRPESHQTICPSEIHQFNALLCLIEKWDWQADRRRGSTHGLNTFYRWAAGQFKQRDDPAHLTDNTTTTTTSDLILPRLASPSRNSARSRPPRLHTVDSVRKFLTKYKIIYRQLVPEMPLSVFNNSPRRV